MTLSTPDEDVVSEKRKGGGDGDQAGSGLVAGEQRVRHVSTIFYY